jgi:hypothetical protein
MSTPLNRYSTGVEDVKPRTEPGRNDTYFPLLVRYHPRQKAPILDVIRASIRAVHIEYPHSR